MSTTTAPLVKSDTNTHETSVSRIPSRHVCNAPWRSWTSPTNGLQSSRPTKDARGPVRHHLASKAGFFTQGIKGGTERVAESKNPCVVSEAWPKSGYC